jgi:predicted ATP-binding protein involved in virulence
MAAITEIHQAVFNYLQDKHPDLRFSLRQVNRYDRLEQGYWFHGNENYMIVSFWEGLDWRNKTPNIFFHIDISGKTRLELVDTDGADKAIFFENIAPSLKATRQGKRFIWMKSYNSESDYISSLESFIRNDKQLIDSFIKIGKSESLFPLIDKDDFENKRARVLDLQGRRIKAKITPLSMRRLELKNIGHFETLELDLSNRVICLIGENGTGKSTILRAILLGLTGITDETQLIDPKNKEIQRLLRIEKEENGQPKFSSQALISLDYFEKDNNEVFFDAPSKDKMIDEKGSIISEGTRVYTGVDSNLSATIGDYFKDLVVALSQVRSNSDGKVNAVEFDFSRAHISDSLSLLYDLADDSFDKFRQWVQETGDPSKKSYIERERDLKIINEALRVIKHITGSETLELMPFELNQKEIFIKTDDVPNGVPLRLMSQGYQNVIGWVGYFIKRINEVTPEGGDYTKTRAILLIDEIDTYLHPKWQRTILNVLATTFTDTYFIITTHSPLVISNLPQKLNVKIYTISKNKTGKIIAFEEPNFNPYGATPDSILENMMNIKDKRPTPVNEMFTAFNKAVQGNALEEAEKIMGDLENLIDPNDPEILRGKTQIEVRKKLKALKK